MISAWNAYWSPIFQALTSQCLNPCREIRHEALVSLQCSLLSTDLASDNHKEWIAIFSEVLFPLIGQLLKPEVYQSDPIGMSDTRLQAATLLCKIFLHHLVMLSEWEQMLDVWLRILAIMDRLMNSGQGDHLVRIFFFYAINPFGRTHALYTNLIFFVHRRKPFQKISKTFYLSCHQAAISPRRTRNLQTQSSGYRPGTCSTGFSQVSLPNCFRKRRRSRDYRGKLTPGKSRQVLPTLRRLRLILGLSPLAPHLRPLLLQRLWTRIRHKSPLRKLLHRRRRRRHLRLRLRQINLQTRQRPLS